MKKVFGIVLLGLFGFVMSVGVATFLLMRYRTATSSQEEVLTAAANSEQSLESNRMYCPQALQLTQMIRVVEEDDEWLVLCRPNKPELVLFSVEDGVRESKFDGVLAPEELQSRLSVEASGDLDGDANPEFVIAFAGGTKECDFPGHYRVAKIVEESKVALSVPFGECMVSPTYRAWEKGFEFFVSGNVSGTGKSVRWDMGAFVFADARALPTANVTVTPGVAPLVTLEARGFLKSGGLPLVSQIDLDGDGKVETLRCRDLGTVGMRCALFRSESPEVQIQTFEPRLSIRVLASKTAGWNDLVLDDEAIHVWQNGKYDIRK